MNAQSTMKIGTKLTISFGVIVLLIFALAIFSMVQMNSIGDTIKRQNHERTDKLERLYVVREALDQTGLAARNAYIFTDDAAASRELDILDQQKAIYLEGLRDLVPLFKDDAAFDTVRKGLLAMAEELKRPRQYRDAKKMQEYGDFLVNECSPLRRQINTDIDAVIRSVQKAVDTDSRNAEASIALAQSIILSVSGIAVVLAAVIGILLTRGLLRQLGGEPADVSRIATRIAGGDLTVNVVTRPGDESSVMHAMKEMRNSLVAIVSKVRAGTETISRASVEIAAGNTDLSSRTEQQAGSIEETASSMEQLTATVKQNADNARQANDLASSASDVAVKGGAVVSRVVDTMGAINESSRKIADIISVIDGIAFQTNILALNAAVEAARAGEQGRGFAVVAAEVRTLAQRSAAAAREIKELISDSVSKVDAGTELVDQAGNTMREIVESIHRVTDIMNEITIASQEQTAGIGQVHSAIGQMDEVIQQNASLVEQLAASAHGLEVQVHDLSDTVSIFRLH